MAFFPIMILHHPEGAAPLAFTVQVRPISMFTAKDGGPSISPNARRVSFPYPVKYRMHNLFWLPLSSPFQVLQSNFCNEVHLLKGYFFTLNNNSPKNPTFSFRKAMLLLLGLRER
jgi:hypothetical protein